jgi:CheY-like chemotaxis protein
MISTSHAQSLSRDPAAGNSAPTPTEPDEPAAAGAPIAKGPPGPDDNYVPGKYDSRDHFLAVVSHELRTPLASIQSWAHVLEHALGTRARQPTPADPLISRALAGIGAGVERQVKLIDALIDATRVLSGRITLARAAFSLGDAVDAALVPVLDEASAKGVTLRTRGTPDSLQDPSAAQSFRIDADFERVRQIVVHLLGNAIKFTPRGGSIEVAVAGEAPSPEFPDGAARLSVSDSGLGLSEEFLPHAFDLFRQADDSYSRGSDGLGLGLTLVGRLVELHRGRVAAISPGDYGGATFVVRLPLVGAVPFVPPAVAGTGRELFKRGAFPSLAGVSVLIVDDQLEVRESLAAMLEQSGAEVLPAASAHEALAQLQARGPAHEPDVLICDIAMPGEDGYATLNRIREWEEDSGVAPARRLVAIALTAFAQHEDRLRALSRGFMLHFAKPVDPQRLLGALVAVTAE